MLTKGFYVDRARARDASIRGPIEGSRVAQLDEIRINECRAHGSSVPCAVRHTLGSADPLHNSRHTRQDHHRLLRANGFESVYSTSFVTTLFPLMMAKRLLDRVGGAKAPAPQDTAAEFSDRVSLPGPLNTAFDWIMRVDEILLRFGFTLPFGGSLLVVARRSRVS